MAAANTKAAGTQPSYVDSPDKDVHETSSNLAASFDPATPSRPAAALLSQMEK